MCSLYQYPAQPNPVSVKTFGSELLLCYFPMFSDLISTDWPTPRGWRKELVEAPTGDSCTGVPGLDLREVLYSLECSTPWREALHWRLLEG